MFGNKIFSIKDFITKIFWRTLKEQNFSCWAEVISCCAWAGGFGHGHEVQADGHEPLVWRFRAWRWWWCGVRRTLSVFTVCDIVNIMKLPVNDHSDTYNNIHAMMSNSKNACNLEGMTCSSVYTDSPVASLGLSAIQSSHPMPMTILLVKSSIAQSIQWLQNDQVI